MKGVKVVYGDGFHVKFVPKPAHKYFMAAVEFPYPDEQVESVTQAIGILDKPGLPWYGQKIGSSGITSLYNEHGPIVLDDPKALLTRLTEHLGDKAPKPEDDLDAQQKLLTHAKLTVNHQRDKAGSRGTSVHQIAEAFAAGKPLPLTVDLPDAEAGYVMAFEKFVETLKPEFLRTEVIVGHPDYRYAGTFDAHARVDGELWLLDYKTSKGVYPESMHAQLEAYDEAAVKMGYLRADKKVIVHLKPDGTYDLSPSVATFEDFLTYLRAFRAHRGIKERAAKARREAKAAKKALEQAA